MKSLGWLFYIGIFLTLSVYNLMVYSGRKEDKSNLYYALIGLTSTFWLFSKTLIYLFTQSPLIIKTACYVAVSLVGLTIVLFSHYFFNLKKLKRKYIFLGYIVLFVLPIITAFFILLINQDIMTANIIVIIPALTFGLMFWSYFSFLIFSTGGHKEKWNIYIYISTTIYSFCYFAYPLLAFLHIDETNQVLTATNGALIMLLATAYFLAKNFNKEHNDLVKLKKTLEKKVRERTKRLEEVYQQKTNFFINLAHETKTPLTLISNYLDKDINTRGHSREIDIVKHNVGKLKKDMTNYLDLEKLERGLIFYNHDQTINLSLILKKKILLFIEIAEKKRITITNTIEENVYIRMDPFAMDRIINNLLDNAIKYTEEDGRIRVTLSADRQKVHFIVNDSGIGISRHQQNIIFKSFYQISHEKRNIQGIGMGLNIVKNIVYEVKGSINIKSELNAGTTFELTFDRYALSEKEKVQKDYSVSKPFDSVININFKPEVYKKERKNILLVEDNPVMANFLQDNLYNDYNVFLAGNGREALEKLDDIAKPNLIISDIMMDEMNGYEFYDFLIQDKRYGDIPVIFLTAMSSDKEKIEGLKKGAVDYICKPFAIDELLHKIHSLLKLQECQKKRQIEKISAGFSKVLFNEFDSNEETSAFTIICNDYKINKKEKQIIKLLIKGLEYKEISQKLDITINMVKKRIHTIYKKLGVQNKVELVNRFKT